MIGVAEDVDGIDHAVGDCGDGAIAIAGGMTLTDLGDLIGESGPDEVVRIGVDNRLGEDVAAASVEVGLAFGDTDVHIGVDRGIATLPNLFDRPTDM